MAEDAGNPDTKADSERDLGLADSSPPSPAGSRVLVRTVEGLTARVKSYSRDQAVARVRALIDQVHATYFELGGALQRIRAEKWYHPHKTFKAYLADLGLSYRRANYFIRIFEVMTREGIEWSRFAHLGWTKMVCLTESSQRKTRRPGWKRAAANSRGQLQAIVNEQLDTSRLGRSESVVRSRHRRDEMLASSPLVSLLARRSRHPDSDPGAEVIERASSCEDLSSRLSALNLREFSSVVSEALMAQDDDAVRSFIRALAETGVSRSTSDRGRIAGER